MMNQATYHTLILLYQELHKAEGKLQLLKELADYLPPSVVTTKTSEATKDIDTIKASIDKLVR